MSILKVFISLFYTCCPFSNIYVHESLFEKEVLERRRALGTKISNVSLPNHNLSLESTKDA